MSRPLSSLLALCLALAISPLAAQTVYQWKDAKGVTHYSDLPPPKGATRREVQTPEGTPATPQAPAADNAQCAQARLNLVRLQGNTEVGLDADSDGKIDAPMSAEQRAKQIELVREAIKTHCPGGR